MTMYMWKGIVLYDVMRKKKKKKTRPPININALNLFQRLIVIHNN